MAVTLRYPLAGIPLDIDCYNSRLLCDGSLLEMVCKKSRQLRSGALLDINRNNSHLGASN